MSTIKRDKKKWIKLIFYWYIICFIVHLHCQWSLLHKISKHLKLIWSTRRCTVGEKIYWEGEEDGRVRFVFSLGQKRLWWSALLPNRSTWPSNKWCAKLSNSNQTMCSFNLWIDHIVIFFFFLKLIQVVPWIIFLQWLWWILSNSTLSDVFLSHFFIDSNFYKLY